MARINPKLLAAIMAKTGLSRAQTYARVQQTANRETLPRDLAAIKLGSEVGVNINKHADASQLAQLRQAGSPVAPPNGGVAPAPVVARPAGKTAGKLGKKGGKKTPNQVFVVYGRDKAAKDAMFTFLRAVGVKPIEWNSALAMSKQAAPYIGEILETAFTNARAIVVLLTPDDLVQLRPDLVSPTDKPYERTLTGQARPNVLFEAGMAFATHPGRTLLVQVGNVKEFSDVGGRHVVHMTDDYAKRQELATKLTNAGCDVDTSGSDWVNAGDFTDPQARTPKKKTKKRK
ncbi:MAG: nucleotide-binding protein [Phycisphaerales bacterium]|nr:nucleotide-binding protein [Phycisphaerales bacterium]